MRRSTLNSDDLSRMRHIEQWRMPAGHHIGESWMMADDEVEMVIHCPKCKRYLWSHVFNDPKLHDCAQEQG